jgi:hypothetical protein
MATILKDAQDGLIGDKMQFAEMIVVLIVILLMYKPLTWLAKKLILRGIDLWYNLDKGVPLDPPELTEEEMARAKTRKEWLKERDAKKKKEQQNE